MVTRALPPELTDAEWRELGIDPGDPFRYGWRYVAHERADGSVTYEQVPLTLEDVLHPQEGDHIMQNEEHIDWCFYLYAALRHLLRRDPLAVVFQDMLFLWDVPGLQGHSPDTGNSQLLQRRRGGCATGADRRDHISQHRQPRSSVKIGGVSPHRDSGLHHHRSADGATAAYSALAWLPLHTGGLRTAGTG
jgi:hypothetical protein